MRITLRKSARRVIW